MKIKNNFVNLSFVGWLGGLDGSKDLWFKGLLRTVSKSESNKKEEKLKLKMCTKQKII
jgi:hypothetical protein